MAVQDDLLAAITADPDDPAPQLVIADWLTTMDDPRGELIVLDHADRIAGGIHDPEALERYLLLAAVYGFPHAREEDLGMLPFEGGGVAPVQYEVWYGDRHYYVRYRDGELILSIDEGELDSEEHPEGFPIELLLLDTDAWTDEEARDILTILSDAIRAGTPLGDLVFPFGDDLLPQYPGVPLRCYQLPEVFTRPRGLGRWRYGLAARDYHRWHALWHRLRVNANL